MADKLNLTITHPELAAQWHPTKNGNLTPERVSKGTVRKVWWLLSYDVPMDYPIVHLRGKHFDFEWDSSPNSRTNNDSGCPYLSNPPKAVWKGFNDLETVNPELAAQWDYEANKGLKDKNGNDISTPDKVTAKSGWVVNWILPYDVPADYPIEHLRGKHFNLKWESEIKNRNSGKGCPYLSEPAQAIWPGFNDLATWYPELAKQWHPIKNQGLKDKTGKDISTPDKVTAYSGQEVYWCYPYDVPMDYPIKHLRGKHFDFEWKATINNRTSLDADCPYLVGKAVWQGFNDLVTTHPKIAKQWHPSKNIGLKNKKGEDISIPDKITAGSGKKVHWLLPYDDPETGKHHDFEWEATVARRTAGDGCPYLTGSAVWPGFNDLLTKKPELATEWHPIKNVGLRDKNGKDISTPDKVTEHSGMKVWWQYKHKDSKTGEIINYEWQSTVNDRANGAGCPFVFSSKGEKAVRKILEDRAVFFKEQTTFPDRYVSNDKYAHPLKDDFAIFDKNGRIVATIEFNGRQHYEPVDFNGRGMEYAKEEFKKTKERDRVKTKYLKDHGIKQLIISYKDFNNATQIVGDFIEELSKTHDLSQPSKEIKVKINNNQKDIQPWQPPVQSSLSSKEVKAFIKNTLNGDKKRKSTKENKKIIEKKRKSLDINL